MDVTIITIGFILGVLIILVIKALNKKNETITYTREHFTVDPRILPNAPDWITQHKGLNIIHVIKTIHKKDFNSIEESYRFDFYGHAIDDDFDDEDDTI